MSATLESTLKLDIASLEQQLAKARGEIKKFKENAQKDSAGLGKGMFGGISNEIKGLLPAIGLAAAAAGVKQLMNEMGDLGDMATRLGETTESIQRVSHAAEIMAGVDIKGVSSSFEKLEKALGDVDNTNTAEVLERLGVSAGALSRMPLEQKILSLADAYEEAKTSGTGYNDLVALLGKSAGDLIPLLSGGREAIQEMFDGANVISDNAVQRMAELGDKTDIYFGKVKAGFGATIGMVGGFLEVLGGAKFEDVFSDKGESPAKAEREREEKAQQREALLAAEAQIKAEEEYKKLQEERAKTLERVTKLQEEARKSHIDSLPPAERLTELMKLQDEKLQDMHLHGGQFYSASIEGMKQLADAQMKSGNLEAAEKTLQNLKEVVALQRQSVSLQESLRKEAAAEAEERERTLQAARESLDAAKDRTADITSTDPARLDKAQQQLDKINQEIESARDNNADTIDLEIKREEVLQTILQLQKQLNDEAEREAEIKDRQDEAMRDFQMELDILREQASGRQRLADQLIQEQRLKEETRRIMDAMNVSESEALRLAKEKLALEEKIRHRTGGRYDENGRRRSDGRMRIDANIDREGIMKKWRQGGLDDYYNDQKTPLRDTFKTPGLDQMDRERGKPLRDQFKFPGLDEYEEMQRRRREQQGPLVDQAKKNDQASNAPSASTIAENAAQEVLKSLPQILVALTQ